ncbi:TetR/AcrR family transcriptional regulator [Actinocorallia aurantiaca]|jgi:AcrR family transcriptional regulator|uniref:TetR/AcrR family transcriptional regulator n=1 Tax=Actinocorallia aurantiaca TaxID=46204 RepID=A0ABP6GQ31_9ACTN
MNEARERLLDAALRLIAEHGVGALTNRRVAAAAGVSLGTLTYHFGSQTDLLRECLDRFADAEIDRITGAALALADAGLSPAQAADEVQRAIVAFANGPEQVAHLELHLQAARDPGLRPAAERSITAYDRLATSILTALGIARPEHHAPTIVTLLYGLAVRRLATGDAAATGTAEALRTVLAGVLAETADPRDP